MKKSILFLAAFALLAVTASAQSRKLNRTKTKPDSAKIEREQKMRAETAKDRERIENTPDKPNTVNPDGTPNDPSNPANNTNGTTPRKPETGKP